MLPKKDFEGTVPAILIQGERQTRVIDSRIQLARFRTCIDLAHLPHRPIGGRLLF
jgi:hypothetical protein